MRLPRPRYTILSLMIVIVLASLVLTIVVAHRERTKRIIAMQAAQADYQNAMLTREVAEIAVTEYKEGIFAQDLATAESAISLAQSDLARAADRLEWAKRMYGKGSLSKAQQVSEELSLQKTKFALEQAQTRKKVLVDYTMGKMLKELESEVEKARSDELARKADYDRLKAIGTGLLW
jgi:hypothetical protein